MDHNKEKETEATIASISIFLDQRGQLIIEHKCCPIGTLKEVLETLPQWDHLQDTVDACRWVGELLNDTVKQVNERYNLDEGIYIQERDV